MINASRLRHPADVIEHDGGRQALQGVLDIHNMIGKLVELDVPAKLVHTIRERRQHFDRRGSCLDQIEADSLIAETGEARELGVADAGVDYRHPARVRSHLGKRVECTTTVGAVRGGRHDHGAGVDDATPE